MPTIGLTLLLPRIRGAGPPLDQMKSPRPQILQVFNQYRLAGGEEASVKAMCNALAQSQFLSSDLLLFRSSDWMGAGHPGAISQALRMIYNPASIKAVRDAQSRLHPSLWVFHNILPVGSVGLYREARQQRIPVIQYIHNFRPFSVSGYLWAGGRIAESGLARSYGSEIRYAAWQGSRVRTAWGAVVLHMLHRSGWLGSVKGWIAVSEFMKGKFVQAGIPAERIHVLPHFREPVASPGKVCDRGAYLFLGALVEMKGVRVLLQAWDILKDRMGPECPVLHIAGEGPLRDEIIARTATNPRVQYVGKLDGEAKDEALLSCRATIVPSLSWEAMGMVVYESYDYLKPVLAARSGGLTENIEHGRTGLLHESGNASELAGQVMVLEADSDFRMAMGRTGRQWLEANRGQSKWLRQYEDIVRQVLGRTK